MVRPLPAALPGDGTAAPACPCALVLQEQPDHYARERLSAQARLLAGCRSLKRCRLTATATLIGPPVVSAAPPGGAASRSRREGRRGGALAVQFIIIFLFFCMKKSVYTINLYSVNHSHRKKLNLFIAYHYVSVWRS